MAGIFAGAMGGCSSLPSLSSLNPLTFFSSADKKPVPLPPIPAPVSTSMIWSANVGKPAGYVFIPVLADRLLYAASNDAIIALTEEGGKVVTRIDIPNKITGGVGIGKEMIVVGTGKGEVVAFDSAGRTLWKNQVNGEILAPPSVTNGAVIVRTSDGRISALNRIDGKRQWVYQRATPALTLRTNAGVLVSRSTIYAGYPGGKLMAIELDSGKPIWEATLSLPRGATELERIADIAALPVLDASVVCAGTYQGRSGCVETLSGNVVWARDISTATGMVLDTKNLYLSDAEGNVHALDKASGASVWKQDKLIRREPGTPLLLNGRLLVGDNGGMVHVLSLENGELIGRIETDGSRINALIAQDERAIVQTEKGGIFAIAVK